MSYVINYKLQFQWWYAYHWVIDHLNKCKVVHHHLYWLTTSIWLSNFIAKDAREFDHWTPRNQANTELKLSLWYLAYTGEI